MKTLTAALVCLFVASLSAAQQMDCHVTVDFGPNEVIIKTGDNPYLACHAKAQVAQSVQPQAQLTTAPAPVAVAQSVQPQPQTPATASTPEPAPASPPIPNDGKIRLYVTVPRTQTGRSQ